MSETRLGLEGMDKRTLLLTMGLGVILSVVFSVVSLLLVVCLIPLQWVYYKAGPRAALLSSVVALVLMVGVRLFAYRMMFGQLGAAAAFDAALPLAMIAGLIMLNLRLEGRHIAPWLRITLAYGVMVAIMVPAGELTFGTPELRSQFEAAASEIFSGIGMGTIDKETLDFSLALSLKFVPLLTLMTVLFNWYVTTWFWRRRLFQWSATTALANYRIAEYMVWPLLFGLAGLAASQVAKLPSWFENITILVSLGMVFIYCLQGLGIIAAFIERRRNPDSRPLSLLLVCMILFMVPGINLVAMVVIPLLGVLEIWVRLRPVTQA